MSSSLLAHLYSHIKGSQEDVATISLQYILSQSSALNHEFTRLLERTLQGNIESDLNYVCQSVGANLERPDIVGIDNEGIERIICEAKFYAGMTDNQPNGYLDRLIKNGGYGLVFICPDVRKSSLWNKLLDLCEGRSIESIDTYCIIVDSIKMGIVTWSDIIESLRHVASSEATSALPDIYQLDGFCRMMDSEAFIPFSAADLGPVIARKEERYYRVVDELIECLKKDKTLHPITKGVKATAYRQGYVKAVRVRGYWVSVSYDRELWTKLSTAETPFWITIRAGKGWEQFDFILDAIKRFPSFEQDTKWGMVYLAIHPKLNATIDEVVADMKTQIIYYIDAIEESRIAHGITVES